jgi:hypothetical protein
MYDGRDYARDYACALLADLGAPPLATAEAAPEHPAASWARSGAMALTGYRHDAPVMCPVPLAAYAEGVLMALAHIGGQAFPSNLSGARLLGERAAAAGYMRNGPIAPGGSCRFLKTRDGWIALNLARSDDWDMLPALLEQEIVPEWSAVAAAFQDHPSAFLLARGHELGLAIAEHGPCGEARRWHEIVQENGRTRPHRGRPPIVIELASLWAGPLCGHLLGLLGARVIKVESVGRPDGARFGPPAFFDLLNAGKESVALDLQTAQGRDQLRALIGAADIVIEGSRPRALQQLGLSAEELLADNPGLIWIGITGYGRAGDKANWIAFGDDAGVAAGLSGFLATLHGTPIFCGDAIGDPLTGLHAAFAAYARWHSGAGGLVSIAIRDVIRHCIAFDQPISIDAANDRANEWQSFLNVSQISAAAPSARMVGRPARPLGADTLAVLRELASAC